MEEIKKEITPYEQSINEKLEIIRNKINEIIEWINKK